MNVKRRDFLRTTALGTSILLMPGCLQSAQRDSGRKPNIIYVFGDQWRAQATGYSGDPNLQGKTPNLDKLAAESVNLSNAVSTCPVCTPYRASLLTGQYPLTHGLFLNDAPLRNEALTFAEVCKDAGYDTALAITFPKIAGRVSITGKSSSARTTITTRPITQETIRPSVSGKVTTLSPRLAMFRGILRTTPRMTSPLLHSCRGARPKRLNCGRMSPHRRRMRQRKIWRDITHTSPRLTIAWEIS